MKSVRQLSLAAVLTLVLSIAAFAGDVQMPGAPDPGDGHSPGRSGEITTPGLSGDVSTPGLSGELSSPGIAGDVLIPGFVSMMVSFMTR